MSVSIKACRFINHRKVLKQIAVSELQPDETVDAVREARLLAKVSMMYHTCKNVQQNPSAKIQVYEGTLPAR